MQNAVLDSYSILSFLFKETGHEKVFALFERAIDADKKLLIAAPNWAEIRYIIGRKVGPGAWKDVREKLLNLPVRIVDADEGLAELAGEIKATHKMSLADCFAAALAKREKAEIYTGDPEFMAIEKEVKVVWL